MVATVLSPSVNSICERALGCRSARCATADRVLRRAWWNELPGNEHATRRRESSGGLTVSVSEQKRGGGNGAEDCVAQWRGPSADRRVRQAIGAAPHAPAAAVHDPPHHQKREQRGE
eukprot:1857521-Prymnesium_polylepis.2